MSLRRRIVLLTAVAVAAASIAVSVLVVAVLQSQLVREVDDSLRDRAASAVLHAEMSPEEHERAMLGTTGEAHAAAGAPGGAPGHFQVLGADGKPVSSSAAAGENPEENLVSRLPEEVREQIEREHSVAFPVTAGSRAVLGGRDEQALETVQIDDVRYRLLTRGLPDGRALQVGRPIDEIDEVVGDAAKLLLLVNAFAVAVALGLGALVARSAMRPVGDLQATTQAVERSHDLDRRVAVHGSDELAGLARSFNSMMDALATAERSQRQLVDDAAHELRTPLTSLRTNVDVLARGHELEPADRADLIRSVSLQLEELGHLVNDLVDLAGTDGPEAVPEDVALDELVATAVESARRRWPDVEFALDSSPCEVHAAPDRLLRALANLLDNAAKWTAPGQPVEVTVADGEVAVRDHGPGVPDEHKTRIFDRFYRTPEARSTPGSGLGLAIVRDVAETAGGTTSVADAPGGGAVFRLAVPAVVRVSTADTVAG